MNERFVKKYGWLEEEEVLDLTSLAQSVPGPIAVNASVLLGYRAAGLPGALTAMSAVIAPPLLIMTAVTYFYSAFASNVWVGRFMQGMSAATVGLLVSITADLFRGVNKNGGWFPPVLAACAFCASLFLPVPKSVVVLGCAAAGLCKTLLTVRKGGGERTMILLKLFLTFAKVGVLAFGGGYVALPLIQEQVVTVHGWMTIEEFAGIMAIDELTPGPILVNAATFVGIRMAGIPGALAATFGSVFPSLVLSLLLIGLYARLKKAEWFRGVLGGLRCMVAGLVGAAALTLFLSVCLPEGEFSLLHAFIALTAFAVLRTLKPEPVAVVLGGGVLGLLLFSFFPAG